MKNRVMINGITISPGDLIFIDDCSMVVIYRKTEKNILDKIFKTIISEIVEVFNLIFFYKINIYKRKEENV